MTSEDLITETERLRAEKAQLRTENAALKQRLAELEAMVHDLQAQLDAALRAGKRQATPFSKGAPKTQPKKPGQKPGHRAAHRAVPEHVDRVVEAALPATCPDCAGSVLEDAVHVQYQEDIPRPVPTIVTQFNVHIGHCAQCQRRLHGRHPDQTSDALGAAAIQLGPHALGLAAEMKHGLGVSYGKVARLLETSLGLRVARSTVARADERLANRLAPTYQQLLLRLRASEVVHADETGWKVAGQKAWLWVFTNDDLSVYTIDPTRAHEVVERILGEDFAGVLGCDCFLAYDALPTYTQSKCAGHLLRRCADISESKSGRAVRFSQQVARLLRAAITLKQRHREDQLSPHGYAVACGRLEAALDRLLAGHYTDPDNARFAKLLRKQRPHLLTFLYVDAMDPTNNAAEREIRPAVLIRKTNGCNRSETGAQTHSILASLIRTCQKHGQDFVNTVKRVLRQPAPLTLDLVDETTR
jgi:transposase